jgi:EamA domain-containing membrane protein RarD
MQLAPFLLLVFGVFIFHEHFSRLQSFGFVALVVGLALFLTGGFLSC